MEEWINSIMRAMGYPGIALLMFLENVFPPIPSELIMPAAGFAAARGELTFWGVVLSGVIGSVLGQLPLYYVGSTLGLRRIKQLTDRYGRWLMISPDSIDRADQWFKRYGKQSVFFCRIVPGLRSFISIPAGIARMSMPSFLLWTLLGTSIWTTTLAALGLILGQNYEQVSQVLGPISTGLIIAAVVAVIVWVVYRRYKARHEQS